MKVALALTPGESGQESGVHINMGRTRAAQSQWAQVPVRGRLRLVKELRGLIAENGARLAEASALSRRRPMTESLTSEVIPLAEACRFLEREADSILRPRRLGRRGRPLWLSGVGGELHRAPLGVVLIIGPGNYPLFLPGVQMIQALVAGNAVLLKPGVNGMDAATALTELVVRAGFDPALVTLLPETAEAAAMAIRARPDKVLLTGSTLTGGRVLEQLVPGMIPATMELGGCDAVIVREDADLELVARALAFGLSLNDGATCMAPKRVFVAAARAAELERRLAESLRGRPPRLFSNGAAAERVHRESGAELALGARLVCGEIRDDGSVIFPLVLGGVSADSKLLRTDTFAPVLAIVSVAGDREAVSRANDCPYGLAASVFSRDEFAARDLAGRLNVGVVTINDLIVPTADARIPFGGRGDSGFGVTRGAEGLLDLTVAKAVTVSSGRFRPAYEPPSPRDEALFLGYLETAHGRGPRARLAGFLSICKSIVARRSELKT